MSLKLWADVSHDTSRVRIGEKGLPAVIIVVQMVSHTHPWFGRRAVDPFVNEVSIAKGDVNLADSRRAKLTILPG